MTGKWKAASSAVFSIPKAKAAANFFNFAAAFQHFPEEHQGSSRLTIMISQIIFVPSLPKMRFCTI